MLKTEPDPIGQSEMVRKLAFDVFKSEELMETLKDHERLIFNEQEKTFAYRHVYNIRSKQDLLDLLKKNREYGGLDYKKIKESYPGLNAPLQELEDEGNVYVLRNQKDNAPRMIFYNDALMNIPMDDEFKEMWNQVDIPKSRAELEIQLEKNGLKSMSVIKEKVIKNQGGPKMKSKRKNGRAKITNTHLEGVSLN